jgi:hypothetical protein
MTDCENFGSVIFSIITMTPSLPSAVSPPKEENNNNNHATTCHWLPCNLNYDGMAPVHQYFQEEPLEDDIRAAQLRGRGLLSHAKSLKLDGALLQFDNCGNIQTQASFQTIREWHHEHSIPAVKSAPSRVQAALEWCQVAQAVRRTKSIFCFTLWKENVIY